MPGRRWIAAVALLLGLVVAAGPLAPPVDATAAARPSAESLRVLVLGDSVSQGAAGDWTWRYRLWEHLARAAVPVDFVGPYTGVYRPETGSRHSQAYVDPDFDRDHGARWGASLATADSPAGLVAVYRPDLVVLGLGLNDLVLGSRDVPALLGLVAAQVAEARAADPTVAVVLTRVAAWWVPGARAFNDGLTGLAATLAPGVVVASPDRGFRRRRDTYDGRHPSARGEVRLAAAVADGVAELGLAPAYARPLPRVPLGPRVAPRLRGRGGGGWVLLRWQDPPGVERDYVWRRDLTARTPWRQVRGAFVAGRALLDGFGTGHTYRFRLQPARGFHRAAADIRSNTLDLRLEPPG